MAGEHIVVSGWYGHNNVGDDAMLTVLLQEFLARLPDARFTVLSEQPGVVEECFGRRFPVRALAHPSPYGVCKALEVPRLSATRAVWGAVKGADAFVLGGGSLVRDHNLSNFLRLMDEFLIARLFGVPAILLGVTVGPLDTAFGRYFVRTALRKAAAVAVRDLASRRALVDVGVPVAKVNYAGDLALLLQAEESSSDRYRGSIAICPCAAMVSGLPDGPPGNPQLVGVLAEVCARLAADFGAKIVLVPFHRQVTGNDDLEVARAIREQAGASVGIEIMEAETPAKMKAMLGGVRLLIGARFHSVVFAASQGIPVVGISYGQKVRNFLGCVGLEDFALDPMEVTVDRVLALCDDLLHARSGCSSAATAVINEMASRIAVQMDVAARIARQAP